MSLFPRTIILKQGFKKLRSKKIVSSSYCAEQLEKREMFAVLPAAELQWSSYAVVEDASDIWVQKNTPQNGFGVNNDTLLMNVGGKRIGMQQNLNTYNFNDPGNVTVGSAARQHQFSDDGQSLYVGGTTPTWTDLNIPASSLNGFDKYQNYGLVRTSWYDGNRNYPTVHQNFASRTSIATSDDGRHIIDDRSIPRHPQDRVAVTPIDNGVFSRFTFNSNAGNPDYTTFVGGNSETSTGSNAGLTLYRQGASYLNSFYVDASKTAGEIFLGGSTNARRGITDIAGKIDLTFKDSESGFSDAVRINRGGALDYDGMLYNINDALHTPANNQLNWATYLSPTRGTQTPPTPDDDTFPDDSLYSTGNVNNIDFMWQAQSAPYRDGSNQLRSDKLLFIIGNRYPVPTTPIRINNVVPTEQVLIIINLDKIMDPNITHDEKWLNWVTFTPFNKYVSPQTEMYRERIIVPNALLSDGSGTGPALLIRYANRIQKLDLPRDGQWEATAVKQKVSLSAYTWGGWTLPFSGDFLPQAMSVAPNGERLYVADSVTDYTWPGLPTPINATFGGKLRSGPSDAALVEFNMKTKQANWMMLSGGGGTEVVTGVAALSDGTVYVTGTTQSTTSETLLDNWIPYDDKNLFGNKMLAPIPVKGSPLGLFTTPISNGSQTGFIYAIKTSNRTLSTAEIDVGGIVSNLYVPILDGASIASAAQGTDFGRTWSGSPTQERTFEIRNTGKESLGIAGIDLPAWLELKNPAPVTVLKGESVQFTLLVKKTWSTVGNLSGTVTIRNTDSDEESYDFKVSGVFILPPPPTFMIAASSVSALEGKIGTTPVTFVVSFLQGIPASVFPASIGYTVVGVSATSGTDFIASSANSFLTFNAGQTSQTVTVNVIGDSFAENDEVFEVRLQNPSTGSVVSTDAPSARFTILNDDGVVGPATVAFSPIAIRVTEGNSGSPKATLMVTLSKPISGPVTVQYATASGTATSGSDFTNSIGTITFPTGSTRQSIDIPIIGDTISEADEVLNVRLMNVQTTAVDGASLSSSASVASITIVNDDGVAPPPRVTVSKPTVIEGNSGSPKLSFAITLAQAASSNVVLKYQTADGTAVAGRDYTTASNTITILAGRTTAVVTINVLPNTKVDGDRTVRLNILYNNSQVAQGIGTIRDDDRRLTTVASLSSQVAMAAAFSDLGSVSGTTSTLKTNSKRIL